MTCRRCVAVWSEAGVWDRLHAALPAGLRAARTRSAASLITGFGQRVVVSGLGDVGEGWGRSWVYLRGRADEDL